MRHQHKGFKLNRTHAHRKATLAALSNALIRHKRITTTLAKARALRMYVEPILNRAKRDTMQDRRQVFRNLQDKESVKELFGPIAGQIGDRLGGYTRVVKLGQRSGDAAEMAVIELVDYNNVKPENTSESKRRRTRRGRSRGQKASGERVAPVEKAAVIDSVAEEAMSDEASEAATDVATEVPEENVSEDTVAEMPAPDEAAPDEANDTTDESKEGKKD